MIPHASVRRKSTTENQIQEFQFIKLIFCCAIDANSERELGSHARGTHPRQQPHNVHDNCVISNGLQKGTPGFEPGTC